jgi:hypothetical protein
VSRERFGCREGELGMRNEESEDLVAVRDGLGMRNGRFGCREICFWFDFSVTPYNMYNIDFDRYCQYYTYYFSNIFYTILFI